MEKSPHQGGKNLGIFIFIIFHILLANFTDAVQSEVCQSVAGFLLYILTYQLLHV